MISIKKGLRYAGGMLSIVAGLLSFSHSALSQQGDMIALEQMPLSAESAIVHSLSPLELATIGFASSPLNFDIEDEESVETPFTQSASNITENSIQDDLFSPVQLRREYNLILQPSSPGSPTLNLLVEEMISEQLPIILMYRVLDSNVDLDKIQAIWNAGVQFSSERDSEFVFTTNHSRIDVSAVFSANGISYEWERENVDLPLYDGLPILFDASKLGIPIEEISSVIWRSTDAFGDSPLVLSNPNGIITSAVSPENNSIKVICELELIDGHKKKMEFPLIIYDREGSPFENRGIAGTFYEAYEDGPILDSIVSDLFSTLDFVGATTLVTGITSFYGAPDKNGNFKVEELHATRNPPYPNPYDVRDPRGYTEMPNQLNALVAGARANHKEIEIQLLAYPYLNDSALAQEYPAWGGGPHAGFMATQGFLEGNGGGLRNSLLQNLDFFIENQDVITTIYLGSEMSDIETRGGAITRAFYESIIKTYRDAGYNGRITHATNSNWDGDGWHWQRVQDPAICGFPWKSSSGPAVTFYFGLAFSASENPSKEIMESRANDAIDRFLSPLVDNYRGQLSIADSYCFQVSGCLFTPITNIWGVPRDIESAMQWHLIWGHAFQESARRTENPWIRLLTFGEQRLTTQDVVSGSIPEWAIKKAYLNEGYDQEDYRAVVSSLFRNVPISSFELIIPSQN